jgi:hypothetical protein
MREIFNPLIKSCGTRTVPAAETKSIGLPADAPPAGGLACLPAGRFFARHPDYFIMTQNSHPSPVPIAIGIGTVKTISRDPKLIVLLPGLPDALRQPADPGSLPPTQLNRRAVVNNYSKRYAQIQPHKEVKNLLLSTVPGIYYAIFLTQ